MDKVFILEGPKRSGKTTLAKNLKDYLADEKSYSKEDILVQHFPSENFKQERFDEARDGYKYLPFLDDFDITGRRILKKDPDIVIYDRAMLSTIVHQCYIADNMGQAVNILRFGLDCLVPRKTDTSFVKVQPLEVDATEEDDKWRPNDMTYSQLYTIWNKVFYWAELHVEVQRERMLKSFGDFHFGYYFTDFSANEQSLRDKLKMVDEQWF